MSLEAAEATARAGTLYPALILHGGSAEERRQVVLRLGRILLCAAAASARPCGECRHCRRIVWPGEAGDRFHPDFQVLERDLKTATSVAATKSFLQSAQVAPFEARGQVFVIAEAETLSGEAANALLKILEEPPTASPRNFLLLAPSLLDLLPTLRSRSLGIYLGGAAAFSAEELEEPARGFAAALRAYLSSGDRMELFAAAAALESGVGWKDPRARRPWERAAAAVARSAREEGLDSALRRRLLALCEDLLEAPDLRLRGIPPRRILEGLVHRRLERG